MYCIRAYSADIEFKMKYKYTYKYLFLDFERSDECNGGIMMCTR